VLLALILACKGPGTPVPRPTFDVAPIGEPEVSACFDEVEVMLRAQVQPEFVGADARFEADGQTLWEGVLARDLELAVSWSPSLGDIRGVFISGESRAGIVFPIRVREAEPPLISSFGLFDGASIAEPADLAGLVDDLYWDGAFPVDPFGAVGLVFTDPHEDLGITSEVSLQRCTADGVCEDLEYTELEGLYLADLTDIANARCEDLSDRSEDTYEVVIAGQCGTTEASFDLRVVHDDCDADGTLAVADCDDQDGAITSPGDIASDGSRATDLSTALLGSEVVVCGGTYPGGWVIDHDLSFRSAGDPALIEAVADAPTIEVTVGQVLIADSVVIGGDAGPRGGGAIAAEAADALTLRNVELRDGRGTLGGNLLGPSNGALIVEGGLWSGGTGTIGGNAFISGGELSNLRIEGGSAVEDGGGLATNGELLATDVDFESNTADRGAGVYLDGAPADLNGCTFVESHAVTAGGAVAAELDIGQVLELRPSAFDLSFIEFDNCTAELGGAVWLSGGALDTTVTVTYDASATSGAAFWITDAAWEDTNSFVLAAEADEDGAFAALYAVTADLFSSNILDSAAGRGALFLASSSTAIIQNVELNGTGCGVWIEEGELQSFNAFGTSDPADVCGPGFESPYAPICTQDGC